MAALLACLNIGSTLVLTAARTRLEVRAHRQQLQRIKSCPILDRTGRQRPDSWELLPLVNRFLGSIATHGTTMRPGNDEC